MNERQEARRAITLGLWVMAALAVLTLLEYVAAVRLSRSTAAVFVLAAVKGWLILEYFMHIRAMFPKEEA